MAKVMPWNASSSPGIWRKVVMNDWNRVAFSYDADTGIISGIANGEVGVFQTALSGQTATDGHVTMGSVYYYRPQQNDRRAFKGHMTCMKLWSTVRNVTTLPIETEGCGIP